MYKILPETENRTLEDIEMHFAGTNPFQFQPANFQMNIFPSTELNL